jgi:hypothetical protein
MEIKRNGSEASVKGPADWFTGTVRIDPFTSMTHIAIQEQLDGKALDWLEKVSDEQYGG